MRKFWQVVIFFLQALTIEYNFGTISVSTDMMRQLEKIFKALADRNRLRIVNMLIEKPMCVCEIQSVLQLSQSTVSGHLRVLKEAGLVEDTKEGLWVEYHLQNDQPEISAMLRTIRELLLDDSVATEERQLASRADRNRITCKS